MLAAGSNHLRSYPPRIGIPFQPEAEALPSATSLVPSRVDIINFQQTPSSSRENTIFSNGQNQMWSSHNKVRTRIKWTRDLHCKFIECVDSLGGADKATPKGILRLIGVRGLTIYHIKSHLQKYRVTRFISESKPTRLDKSAAIDLKTGKQIAESLQMQLDVQMRLQEQLQIQKDLQLKIEEQGRQLKLLLEQRLEQQTKNNTPISESQSLDF